jgi:hypothetical protein
VKEQEGKCCSPHECNEAAAGLTQLVTAAKEGKWVLTEYSEAVAGLTQLATEAHLIE